MATNKAYGSLVEDFIEKWKRQSQQVFEALGPEQRALRAHGMKVGNELATWWSSQQEVLWAEMCDYFGRLKNAIDQGFDGFTEQTKQEILDAAAVGTAAHFKGLTEFFNRCSGLQAAIRLMTSEFDPSKKESSARTLIKTWWERNRDALGAFSAEPLGKALLSSVGFADPNLVACNEVNPHPNSYKANAPSDPQLQWFFFPEQPPEHRSGLLCLPRKEVAVAFPAAPPEFSHEVEVASVLAAKKLWSKQVPTLNAFHAMEARSPWVACKALDLLIQPKSLSEISLSQEWFWQVGVTFDDWMKGRLGTRPPDKLRLAATFFSSVYCIVDNKVQPNWLARVSQGQPLSSDRAEPIVRLIAFVMQRLAQWEAERCDDTPSAQGPKLPSISVNVRPAERRRRYWLIVNNREEQKSRIPEAVVDVLELLHAGEGAKDVSYETVRQLLSANKVLSKHIQVGKKVGNRIQTVAAPSLVNRITIERHPARPDRQHKR